LGRNVRGNRHWSRQRTRIIGFPSPIQVLGSWRTKKPYLPQEHQFAVSPAADFPVGRAASAQKVRRSQTRRYRQNLDLTCRRTASAADFPGGRAAIAEKVRRSQTRRYSRNRGATFVRHSKSSSWGRHFVHQRVLLICLQAWLVLGRLWHSGGRARGRPRHRSGRGPPCVEGLQHSRRR